MQFDFEKVFITDMSLFDESRQNNGGGYSFTTTYTPVGVYQIKDSWKTMFSMKYSTTSEFAMCENSGLFGDTRELCPQLITEDELLLHIKYAEKSEHMEVRYVRKESETLA